MSEVVCCSRCNSMNVRWNSTGWLICFNCGKVLVEPEDVSEIQKGIMAWSLTVKERLWRLRENEREIANET